MAAISVWYRATNIYDDDLPCDERGSHEIDYRSCDILGCASALKGRTANVALSNLRGIIGEGDRTRCDGVDGDSGSQRPREAAGQHDYAGLGDRIGCALG